MFRENNPKFNAEKNQEIKCSNQNVIYEPFSTDCTYSKISKRLEAFKLLPDLKSYKLISTPDNNDVPNQLEKIEPTELQIKGEEPPLLDLGLRGKFTTSFLKSSDSLDNKCKINESKKNTCFGEIPFETEAKLFCGEQSKTNVPITKHQLYDSKKDYMNTMLTPAVSTAKFDSRQLTSNCFSPSFGYYSKYLGIDKPFYNKQLFINNRLQRKSFEEKCYYASYNTNENICPKEKSSPADTLDVSDLINYFESEWTNPKGDLSLNSQLSSEKNAGGKFCSYIKKIVAKTPGCTSMNCSIGDNYVNEGAMPYCSVLIPPPVEFQTPSSRKFNECGDKNIPEVLEPKYVCLSKVKNGFEPKFQIGRVLYNEDAAVTRCHFKFGN